MELTLKTKFDIGDTIFFLSDTTQRIIQAKVIEIVFYIEAYRQKTYYKTEPYAMEVEDRCFGTREEIINKL